MSDLPWLGRSANRSATGIGLALGCHCRYRFCRFSRPSGSGLRTIGRVNDFDLYGPARRAGLDPLTSTPEGVLHCRTTLLYWRRRVKSAGSTQRPSTKTPRHVRMPTTYDLVIGLYRSDPKAVLCLINPHTGDRRTTVIATTPEALWNGCALGMAVVLSFAPVDDGSAHWGASPASCIGRYVAIGHPAGGAESVVEQTGHTARVAAFVRDTFAGSRNGHPHRAGFVGHKDVTTTKIYTHVMQKPGLGARSPLDG